MESVDASEQVDKTKTPAFPVRCQCANPSPKILVLVQRGVHLSLAPCFSRVFKGARRNSRFNGLLTGGGGGARLNPKPKF